MTLDELYGIVIGPARSRDRPDGYWTWELDLRPPSSYSVLDAESAKPLRAFMKQVSERWTIGDVLVNRAVILYVVDEFGSVRFALEEAVEEDPSRMPVGRDYRRLHIPFFSKLLRTDKKLGHPSLVDCGSARIAGQIMFQPAADGRPPYWTIDAWSGRYGRTVEAARREPRHVDNVIAVFRSHGIVLSNAFGPP